MKHFIKSLIAKMRGTFYTDCPRCFKYFHGLEAYKTQVKLERHYRLVCHTCAKEQEEMEKKAV